MPLPRCSCPKGHCMPGEVLFFPTIINLVAYGVKLLQINNKFFENCSQEVDKNVFLGALTS